MTAAVVAGASCITRRNRPVLYGARSTLRALEPSRRATAKQCEMEAAALGQEALDQAAWDSVVELDTLTVIAIVDNETDGNAHVYAPVGGFCGSMRCNVGATQSCRCARHPGAALTPAVRARRHVLSVLCMRPAPAGVVWRRVLQ